MYLKSTISVLSAKFEYIKYAVVIRFVFFPEDVCYYCKVECPNHSRLSCKQNLVLLIALSNLVYGETAVCGQICATGWNLL